MTDGLASDGIVVVLTNCPPDEAPGLAKALVTERLAACANIAPAIRSTYVWQGELCEETESTVLLKTTVDSCDELMRRLRELHSYSTPEILVFRPEQVDTAYAAWVRESVGAHQ
jgi:periplasmic divalent cation tolerance protein